MVKIRVSGETKEERFRRVATARTNAVLDKIRLLGHLSNKRIYDYKERDIEKIFLAINQQLKEVRIQFNNSSTRKRFEL